MSLMQKLVAMLSIKGWDRYAGAENDEDKNPLLTQRMREKGYSVKISSDEDQTVIITLRPENLPDSNDFAAVVTLMTMDGKPCVTIKNTKRNDNLAVLVIDQHGLTITRGDTSLEYEESEDFSGDKCFRINSSIDDLDGYQKYLDAENRIAIAEAAPGVISSESPKPKPRL